MVHAEPGPIWLGIEPHRALSHLCSICAEMLRNVEKCQVAMRCATNRKPQLVGPQ